MRRLGRVLGWFVGAGVLTLSIGQASAQLDLSKTQRAADGTVYEVIRVPSSGLLAGVDRVRVTTVSGSIQALSACSSGGGGSGTATSAASGADANVPAVLRPYADTIRTGILSPNDDTVNFESGGAGRLTLGSGGSAIDVCRVASDCSGGATDTATFGLSSSAGGVPTACVASGVSACGGQLSTYAFGLIDNSNPPACASAPTTATTQCATAPADGFSLSGGQVVVFIYDHSLGMSGFSSGVSGFGVDNDASALCSGASNRVLTADGKSLSAPPPPAPVCGDGHVDSGEQCDDGNQVQGDGCENDCTLPRCGNGIVDNGEECDDGNQVNGDGCNNDCRVSSGEMPPPGNVAPAMGPLGGLITAAGLLLAGRRALRRPR